MDWKLMIESTRAAASDAPLGDAAALKFAALSGPGAKINQRLAALGLGSVDLRIDELRAMAPGTLGREYARFLDERGLEHLTVSEGVAARLENNPFALRYAATHDLHHLLTGFDTGLAGELGVAAFSMAQGSGLGGEGLLSLQRLVVCLLSPSQARAVWHNVRHGLSMGRRTELLLTAPFEAWLDQPLSWVRARVGITAEMRAEILPSRRSLYAEVMYRALGRELPEVPAVA